MGTIEELIAPLTKNLNLQKAVPGWTNQNTVHLLQHCW